MNELMDKLQAAGVTLSEQEVRELIAKGGYDPDKLTASQIDEIIQQLGVKKTVAKEETALATSTGKGGRVSVRKSPKAKTPSAKRQSVADEKSSLAENLQAVRASQRAIVTGFKDGLAGATSSDAEEMVEAVLEQPALLLELVNGSLSSAKEAGAFDSEYFRTIGESLGASIGSSL
ncbi:MAG TPA: hypothetical protein V6D29_13185 [Leptolyngbyaceae cyanobacterium]